MSDTIEPCPYCGGAAIAVRSRTRDGDRHWFECYHTRTCGARGPDRETREQAIADWNRVARAGQRWRFDDPPPNRSVLINVPDAEHYGPGIYRAIRVVDSSPGLDLPPRWHTTAVFMGRDIEDDRVKGWHPLPEPPGDKP